MPHSAHSDAEGVGDHGRSRHHHPHLETAERSPAFDAWIAFHQVMQSHRHVMVRKLAERGLHFAQALCLKEAMHQPGISQRDLAERLHVSRPTVTAMLQKMEKVQLIERRVDELDQRYTRIFVTEKGAQLHLEMHAVIGEIVEGVIGPMPEKDRRELARLLGNLDENYQRLLATPAEDSKATRRAPTTLPAEKPAD